MELFHLNLNAVRGLIIVFRLSLLWVNVNEIHVRICCRASQPSFESAITHHCFCCLIAENMNKGVQ